MGAFGGLNAVGSAMMNFVGQMGAFEGAAAKAEGEVAGIRATMKEYSAELQTFSSEVTVVLVDAKKAADQAVADVQADLIKIRNIRQTDAAQTKNQPVPGPILAPSFTPSVGTGREERTFAPLPFDNPLFTGNVPTPELSRQLGILGPETVSNPQREDFVQTMTALSARLRAQFGADNYFAGLIDKYIEQVRRGTITPRQALEGIRGYLGVFYERIQRESQAYTGEMRSVSEDLLAILRGQTPAGTAGRLTPGGSLGVIGGELTAGPRTNPTQPTRTAGAATTAGIGGAATAALATHADVVGLGKAITGEVTGLRARIAAATTAVTASAAKTDNVFRTIQQNHVEANRALAEQFRHLEGGALRRIEHGIHTMPQFNPADLAQALQRMNLSGQLSSQATT